MYIVDVIPLANIPRPNVAVFTYFYPRPLNYLSLVTVPVGRKQLRALVVGIKDTKSAKLALRKGAGFTLKEIIGVLHAKPVLFEWQLALATWIADYYWVSLGLVLKKIIPDYLLQQGVKFSLGSKRKKPRQRLFLFPDTSFFSRIELAPEAIRVTSTLTKKREFLLFKELAQGKKIDIAGTRRALFAPYNRLKEIHIYEETDANHRSWEQRPRISAVTVAKKLAQLHDAKVVYHSTLPSLESYVHKIPYQDLSAPLISPKVVVHDLTLEKEKLHTPFSESVKQELRDTYLAGKQAIVYVNRRGEGRFLLCRDCGFVPMCKNCDVSLTLHSWVKGRPSRTLLCHHCGYQELPPSVCAKCGSHEIRVYGFGSERAEQELSHLFPKAGVFRLDSDRATNEHIKAEILGEFSRKGNFLVATSMLFSALPQKVDLVVALNPDAELNIPDYAQHEKLFFSLWRLRQWTKNVLSVQTYSPNHPVFESLRSGQWKAFYREELAVRKTLNYPPFSSIIKLICLGRSETKVAQEARIMTKKFEQSLKNTDSSLFTILGPAPAFLPRVKDKYRYTMLIKIKSQSVKAIEGVKRLILPLVPFSCEIDVDPIDSL